MTDVSVTLRPPCLCPSEGHKQGVSIQSSINLGHTLPQIRRGWKRAETWIFARLFIYQSSIVSQTLDFFHWMVTIFILITWLVKTENFLSEDRRTIDFTKFHGKRFATDSIYIPLSSTLQRRKRSPKTEPFENALQSGAIWKRCFLKTLFSSVEKNVVF